MEERIIDREEGRGIRLTRTEDGETDAQDALTPEEEQAEEELMLSLPDTDEYDEDLVGLTPSQLKEELERRERAKREAQEMSAKLTQEGEDKLANEDFEGAANCFSQALVYGFEDERAEKGLWQARTHNFAEIEPLLEEDAAEELASSASAHALVLEKLGDRLREERENNAHEESELAPSVEEKQRERRSAFAANRKYYLLRFCIFFGLCVLCAVGCAVSASYILRTLSIAPVVLTAVFGGLTFVMLVVTIVFTRKLIVAARLCRVNERLASTGDGARLVFLRERIERLEILLSEPQNVEEQADVEVQPDGETEPAAEASTGGETKPAEEAPTDADEQ